jgi:hypothetical protein
MSMSNNKNEKPTVSFDFDSKGHGGPEFSTEAEVLEYIDSVLLADKPSRDPKEFRVQMFLNGVTLCRFEEGSPTYHQWSESAIARFPDGGHSRELHSGAVQTS